MTRDLDCWEEEADDRAAELGDQARLHDLWPQYTATAIIWPCFLHGDYAEDDRFDGQCPHCFEAEEAQRRLMRERHARPHFARQKPEAA